MFWTNVWILWKVHLCESLVPKYKLLCFIITKFFCKEKNTLAFRRDRCCHLVLCLRLIPFHWTTFHDIQQIFTLILFNFVDFINFCFHFWWFQKLTSKFWSYLNWLKARKFQTWQWRKLKKSIFKCVHDKTFPVHLGLPVCASLPLAIQYNQ